MSTQALDRQHVEQETLSLVKELLAELGSHEAAARVALDSSFDRDLGLGSLERVELLIRTERRLGVRVPEALAQRADTPAEWVRSLLEGEPPSGSERPVIRQPGDAAPPPIDAVSFSEVLRRHAERDPGRVQVHLLEEGQLDEISYGRLLAASQEVAAGLIASGLQPNETVAVMLPTCADFLYSFLGVALAGGIAVPIYPPARPDKIEEYVRRQTLILRNAEVRFLISFDQVKAVSQVMSLGIPSLKEVTTVDAMRARGYGSNASGREDADAFFIQYTSGSTGNPKGVVLTHANVLANVQGIGWAVKARPDDAVVSWLPLYHDMGLIGAWLFSLFYGFPITMMSPLAFLSRPERWLWALSDSGGSLCPAPNFAYELCARKITDEALGGVDLSRWRIAINAGEPVLPDTLERFAARFAPYGFRAESYVPCYGLAESSVALTFPPINRPPVVDRVRRGEFEKEGRAIPADATDENVLRFVANGRALPGHEVRIVDENGHDVAERTQGRLIFRGLSKTSGYFRNDEATAAVTDADGWMDSGDLAYCASEEVHITGRLKDCIIKAGHNIIPQEVEMAAADVAGVRRGCVAAFGSTDASSGTERLIVVAETRSYDAAERARIRAAIVRAIDEKVGLPPDVVELVPPQTVPKTSSGKIRRNETRSLFEQGALRPTTDPPWLQMIRLWTANLGQGLPRAINRIIRRANDAAVAGYRRGLLAGIATLGGLIARLAPTPNGATAIVRAAARILRRAGVSPAHVAGNSVHPPERPCLLASNRLGTQDLLALVDSFEGPLQLADSEPLRDLPWDAAFLFEPLLADSGDQQGSAAVLLKRRVRQALDDGSIVIMSADSPANATPQRTRFRLEPIEAAIEADRPVIPVHVGNGDASHNGASADGASLNGAHLIRVGPPVDASGMGPDAALMRDCLRESLRRLKEQDLPAAATA
ncbi:MAG: AMP-binding protein [Acidobacteria bacterium]|nr:AMP-binding protein [Acidobacteriota bacterium]